MELMQYRMITLVMLLFVLYSCLFGCTQRPTPFLTEKKDIEHWNAGSFHHFELEACHPVDTTGMIQKPDHFMVIFDPSASMTQIYEPPTSCHTCHEKYSNQAFAKEHVVENGGKVFDDEEKIPYQQRCNECHGDLLFTKFKFAKQLALCMNKMIPDLDMTGTLRVFGYPVYSMIESGPETYDRKAYERSLKRIINADGVSPLALTLAAAKNDFSWLKGKKEIIIISDGMDMGPREVIAAEELKAKYGDDLCISAIHVGNNTSGQALLAQLVWAGGCGMSVSGEDLLIKEGMEHFIQTIFFKKETDTDGDGVENALDDCPDTRPGLEVDENGCWRLVIFDHLLFDFDKYDLKPEARILLNRMVDVLKKYDFLNLHISGHTDNYGSMEYNTVLSEKRARSGLNYIKNQGIDPKRLSMSGHSYNIPAADNKTNLGRSLNRRLEFKFLKR